MIKKTLKAIFKNAGIFLISAFLTIGLINITFAQDINNNSYHIKEFKSEIFVEKDSSLIIKETITANFTPTDKGRGIIRSIPVNYMINSVLKHNLYLKVLSVKDEKGNPLENLITKLNGIINIRIGNENIWHQTPQTYQITYNVKKAVNFFENHDELYWNVTGDRWDASIAKVSATVIFPEAFELKESEIQKTCYTGRYGSTAQDCKTIFIDSNTIKFSSNTIINPNEQLTIIVGIPKKLIAEPSVYKKIFWFWNDNFWTFFYIFFPPTITFFVLYLIWLKNGRDPKPLKTTKKHEFDIPDNLTPAQVGTLIDEKVDSRDIIATIIHLAIRGYLKITETKNRKFTLHKLSEENEKEKLTNFEKTIFNKIFSSPEIKSVSIDSLKYKFYKIIPKFEKELENSLIEKNYYTKQFLHIRKDYINTSAVMLGIPLFIFPQIFIFHWQFSVGYITSCLIIGGFGYIMSQKTQKGVDILQKIKGFEKYIITAEKDRIKFYEKENIFEKILPYAIAFGIADKWTNACADILKQSEKLHWLESTPNRMTHRSFLNFSKSLNKLSRSLSTNLYSTPRTKASGGTSGFRRSGGSSGGGFGGGGGRRW